MDKYSFSLYTHPTLKVQNVDYNQYKFKANWKLSVIRKLHAKFGGPKISGPLSHAPVGSCFDQALDLDID